MAEPSHITNRNRGHRSRSRSYRPPIIKAEARLCPNCEKPTSLGASRCNHCGGRVASFGTNQAVPAPDSLLIQVAEGKRVFMAYSIDTILALTALSGLTLLLSSGPGIHGVRGAHALDSALLWFASELMATGLSCLAVFTCFLLYQCSSVARSGYTPGRRLAGIVLVHRKGKELSRTRLLCRACLSLFSWLFLAMGYFWPLLDKYNRSLHDICTQTLLVQRSLKLP